MEQHSPQQQLLDEILVELDREADQNEKPYNKEEYRDKTRSRLASWFIIGYFALVGVMILGIPLYNAYVVSSVSSELVLDFQETFMSVSSSIVGLLGFVLGFYFKEGDTVR